MKMRYGQREVRLIRFWKTVFSIVIFYCIFLSGLLFAANPKEDSEVEALYDKFDQQSVSRKKTERAKKKKRRQRYRKNRKSRSLDDLQNLEPIKDIVVIHRRFLPKSSRMELSVSAVTSINNAFFSNIGGSFRGTYYFKEKYGLELMYFLLSDSARGITNQLQDERKIRTQSLVVPKSFFGANIKWTPLYGKMALLNKKIVPFDIYFSPGFGMTSTELESSIPTISLGTGQIFAINKSAAFRWDFTWNFYQTEAVNDGQVSKKLHNDLFLLVGMSFFFPEATYR